MKYRMLKVGDVIKRNDELLQGGRWVSVQKSEAPGNIGIQKLVSGNWVRRPIKAKSAHGIAGTSCNKPHAGSFGKGIE